MLHDTAVCFYICTAIFGRDTIVLPEDAMPYLDGQAKTVALCSRAQAAVRLNVRQYNLTCSTITDGTAPQPCLLRQRQQEVTHLGPVLLPAAAAATAPAGVPPKASSAGISSPP
ncbi:unnamed protein product [Ectocarpus sp. 6 AP-2014]